MDELLKSLGNVKIVPVAVIENEDAAQNLADALIGGGLPCIEVTFRTNAARNSIKIITDKYPEMLVGAGTVLTTSQVDMAVQAGAKFIVSPGFNPKVVQYCLDNHIPIIPGCCTPSEVEQALDMGITAIKFFPAEAAGGVAMINALSAPYKMVKFMPTGGINLQNIASYLSCENVIACGGSWMVSGNLIKNGEFEKVKELTEEAVKAVLEV